VTLRLIHCFVFSHGLLLTIQYFNSSQNDAPMRGVVELVSELCPWSKLLLHRQKKDFAPPEFSTHCSLLTQKSGNFTLMLITPCLLHKKLLYRLIAGPDKLLKQWSIVSYKLIPIRVISGLCALWNFSIIVTSLFAVIFQSPMIAHWFLFMKR